MGVAARGSEREINGVAADKQGFWWSSPAATFSNSCPAYVPPPTATASPSLRPLQLRMHRFEPRHNSLTPTDVEAMSKACGFASLDELITATVRA